MIKTRLEKVWLSRVPCFVEVNYGGGISRHNLHLRDVIAIDKAASYRTLLTARLNYVAPNHREKTNKAATRKYGDDILLEFSMQKAFKIELEAIWETDCRIHRKMGD